MTEKFTPIGKYLDQVKREVILKPEIKYNLLGVRWYGNGVFIRESKLGKEIKATKLYKIEKGDFIYNRLFAWKSSFAIIPQEFNGCLVSGEFPTFVYNKEDVNIDFILNYILLPHNIHILDQLSTGMSSVSRKRFKENAFLSFRIPAADLREQEKISASIFKHQSFNKNLEGELNRQQSLLKQLRQAVLQEAVEGRLTAGWRSRHPELVSGSHHAARLLEKIKAEKEKLAKDTKRTKKEKELPPINPDEIPFDLPEGWVWTRISSFNLIYIDCPHSTPKYSNEGYICLLSQNISEQGLILNKAKYVDKQEYDKRVSRLMPERNDVVYIREGGRLGISSLINTDNQICLGQRVMLFRPLNSTMSRYFNYLLNSNIIRKHIDQTILGAATPRINIQDIISYIIPVPPLAEQQAIVEKVDLLLSKIDTLKSQVTARKEQTGQLMQAVLRQAFKGN